MPIGLSSGMSGALVSSILGQLVSVISEAAWQGVTLPAEVEHEVERLMCVLESIHDVLEDAEEKQLTDESIHNWLDSYKEAAYDMEDALDEWNTALRGVKKISNLKAKVLPCVSSPAHNFSSKIKLINARLDEIAKEINQLVVRRLRLDRHQQRRETESFLLVDQLYEGDGITRSAMDFFHKDITGLLCESTEEESSIKIFSIVGMGGSGKTHLSQLIYSDSKVKKDFHVRLWVCVSYIVEPSRVAKDIIMGLDNCFPYAEYNNLDLLPLESLLERISNCVEGKKVFLVLDDVWECGDRFEKIIQAFKCGAPGSRILVTTRNKMVAVKMGSIRNFELGRLSDEFCWRLLMQTALLGRDPQNREVLEEIGRKVSRKCMGLPLAARHVGALLRSKASIEEWQQVLDSDIWQIDDVREDIFAPLLLSYYELPLPIRRCFQYCAVFPKDFLIQPYHLIRHWMAQGYLGLDSDPNLEITGKEYFYSLSNCCLLQDFDRGEDDNIITCKMHDLVHDLALSLMGSDVMRESHSERNSSKEPRHLTLVLEEGTDLPTSLYSVKKLRTLLVIFKDGDSISNEVLCKLFNQSKRLRVLDLNGPIGSIPEEIGELIHLRNLSLFQSHELKRLPESLCELLNLQILCINDCSGLTRFPDKMVNLINLRTIDARGCIGLTYSPKDIGRLTALREIQEIPVRADKNDPAEFSLGDLENLDNLCVISIVLTGNAIDNGELSRARLEDKTDLTDLKLCLTGALREEVVSRAFDDYIPLGINLKVWRRPHPTSGSSSV